MQTRSGLYCIFLLLLLANVFFIPDCFTDRFFTSGMLWTGIAVGVSGCVWVLGKRGGVRCSVVTLGVEGMLLGVGVSAWIAGRWGWQPVVFYGALCLLMVVLDNSAERLLLRTVYRMLAFLGGVEALLAVGQYAGVLEQMGRCRVTGSFDNPAGLAACLSVCFPCGLYLCRREGGVLRVAGLVSLALMLAAVVLAESRTGMVVLVVLGVWGMLEWGRVWRWCVCRRRLLCVLLPLLLCVGVAGGMALYRWKKDSADGRLLIWRSSLEMLADAPLLGHGAGGFCAKYMDYQAVCLETFADGRLCLLADNVKHPFNEYLKVRVEYGAVGLLLLVGAIGWLWRAYRRSRWERHPLFLGVAGVLLCGMFSYPLNYPAINVLFFMLLGLIGREERCFRLGGWGWKVVGMPLFLWLALFTVVWWRQEVEWHRVSLLSSQGRQGEVEAGYATLYPFLSENPLFLYNYAAELNDMGLWKDSHRLLLECLHGWNDTDVQMLLADNCEHMCDYVAAEYHFRRAAAMCPNRFLPLYRLVKLYQKTGEEEKALLLAARIVAKPVKVPSYVVEKIKREMRELL